MELTAAKRRLLGELKQRGPMKASALAECLRLTDVAVRQHLQALEQEGRVTSTQLEPRGRGRPAVAWELTASGHALFPERHADLTLEFIAATREALGESALDQIIAARVRKQIDDYERRLPATSASLKKRVEALAEIRTEEGYMAEAIAEKRGTYLLVEHHCPICDAAQSCVGLCKGELDVFRAALGDDVHVERIAHLLSGEERCVYRITKAPGT